MSDPHPARQQPPGGGINAALVAVGAVLLATMMLSCLGVCAGLAYLARGKLQRSLNQAGVPIRSLNAEPPATDWNDWMVRRELTHLYQTSLESVLADKSLAEKLGGSVAPSLDGEELFRRTKQGIVGPERIEFEVTGSHAKGTVVVDSDAGGTDGFQPATITVTVSDGSVFKVAPLYRALPPVR